jgi:hypothetical protein
MTSACICTNFLGDNGPCGAHTEHRPYVQKLGRNSLGNFFARGKCACGWVGRQYKSRQTAVAVSCAQSDVETHLALNKPCTCLPGQAKHEPGCQLWISGEEQSFRDELDAWRRIGQPKDW